LRVCDTGNAVGDEVVDDLLRTPVASVSGFGIGLYHAARQAECCGHELRLVSNRCGRVCFELRRRPPDGAAGR
jgi:sensor histidine kinase regulating citrate/malate metabolism